MLAHACARSSHGRTHSHAHRAQQQRNRAIAHIIKHAGAYAKDATKTKWVVDLVRKVDSEVRADNAQQAADLAALQAQLAALQAGAAAAAQEARRTQQQLQEQQQEQALELYNSRYALGVVQVRGCHRNHERADNAT